MKLVDKTGVLSKGLNAIKQQYKVPDGFPTEMVSAAAVSASRVPDEHVDRTHRPFLTLDPAGSTDLDQAFDIERSGADLLLHYAIADVAWFVQDGDALDAEAWRRAVTLYLPGTKASLYPVTLSEGAASLLPDRLRPAVVSTIRVGPDGTARLDGVERALVRSRAKLAYETVRNEQLPTNFAEFADRITEAEDSRGAGRVETPEQEVVAHDGGFDLAFRPRRVAEGRNAALSLAANLAIADALLAHRTGLFRVMSEPDAAAVAHLRLTARALDIPWPEAVALPEFRRSLDASDPKAGAMMMAIRRAGSRAAYMPYRDGVVPWHAAMAATYCHATAPLRRLADRYVQRAVLAIANGQPVPVTVEDAFQRLPPVMAHGDSRQGQIDRAVIDLAEAVMLSGREGETFAATVVAVDQRGPHIQLRDLPVVTQLDVGGLGPGDALNVRLISADVAKRRTAFARV